MGAQLMAIAAEGNRQRYYLPPSEEHEKAADVPRPDDVPEEELAIDPRNLWTVSYGLTRFADLFTNRQLIAMTTFTDSSPRNPRRALLMTALKMPTQTGLRCTLHWQSSRTADLNNSIVAWSTSRNQARNLFARQAIPMSWDFAEVNPFAKAAGDISVSVDTAQDVIRALPVEPKGIATQADATEGDYKLRLVATDPPYYDNIYYADLADFFYVWLRRSIGDVYPNLLGTVLTPKADELVADPLQAQERGRGSSRTGIRTSSTASAKGHRTAIRSRSSTPTNRPKQTATEAMLRQVGRHFWKEC